MILDISEIRAIGRVSDGELGCDVLRRGRMNDCFNAEGKTEVEKDRLTSFVRKGTE